MSKTAVQQGIEKLWVLYQNTNSPKEKGELSAIITTFEFLLEVEKQQIEKVIIEMLPEYAPHTSDDVKEIAEQYYKDTYDK